jgi:hypothetical protein
MEAPTTSAASAITMIAPKRAVMIDDLASANSDLPDSSPKDLVHPSLRPRAHPEQWTRTKFLSADRPDYESVPITCSTCSMTYLPTAVPAASDPLEEWACDGCHQSLGYRRQTQPGSTDLVR